MNKRGQETTYPIVSFEGSANKDLEYRGMTIREKMAATLSISHDYSDAFIAAIMGEQVPKWQSDSVAHIKYMARFEAKLRVACADALLDELNKHNNP